LGRTKIPRITKSNQAEIEKRFKPRASNRGATIPLLALDIAPDLASIHFLILGQIGKACHKQARCVCAWLTQIRFSTSHRAASRIGQVIQHQLAHFPETGAAMVRRPSQVDCWADHRRLLLHLFLHCYLVLWPSTTVSSAIGTRWSLERAEWAIHTVLRLPSLNPKVLARPGTVRSSQQLLTTCPSTTPQSASTSSTPANVVLQVYMPRCIVSVFRKTVRQMVPRRHSHNICSQDVRYA
jgi:hypothetical protein